MLADLVIDRHCQRYLTEIDGQYEDRGWKVQSRRTDEFGAAEHCGFDSTR
jgi:hypothetical protein